MLRGDAVEGIKGIYNDCCHLLLNLGNEEKRRKDIFGRFYHIVSGAGNAIFCVTFIL